MDEQVDILQPPLFTKTGVIKTREQAYRDSDWIATFNLWIVTKTPQPSIIYQQRSPNVTWAPGLLDVAAGGHLSAGEEIIDGLREVDEELGRHFAPDQLTFLGKKLYVGQNTHGTRKQNVIGIYLAEDDAPLSAYALQPEEVYAICACPIAELLKAHQNADYHFEVTALTSSGEQKTISVSQSAFPENYDNYHYKMAVLADRYFKGEKDLLY